MRPEQRHEIVARRLGRIAGLDQADGVPEVPVEPEVGPGDDPIPGLIPIPGRHARRRAVERRLLPGLTLEPRHLGVVALLACAALAVTLWWMVARTPTVQTNLSSGTSTSTAAGPTASAGASDVPLVDLDTTPSGATSVTVDVAGRVHTPGVRTLPAGSRVVDALQAAGGARRGADLTGINQARLLVDGEQILVGTVGTGGAAPAASGASGSAPGAGGAGGVAAGGLVNLNTATADQLDTLPGVGPVTAAAILDYRTQHGGFAAVAELLDVDGIGDPTLC